MIEFIYLLDIIINKRKQELITDKEFYEMVLSLRSKYLSDNGDDNHG
jgi:hypothetical protein